MAKVSENLVVYKKEELAKMIGELPFTSDQFNMLMAPTPRKYIKNRPMPGGGTADFVSGHYVTNVLNFVTAYKWSFEVLSEEEKYGQIIVKGKLSFPGKNGETIVKVQYGRATIKKYSEYVKSQDGSSMKRTDGKGGTPVDYGNDFKAAATDALKKCASMAGIAWDVYGQEDFKQMKIADDEVVESANDVPHEKQEVSIDDIKTLVDLKLNAMSGADKVKTLHENCNVMNTKSLSDANYRYLYSVLSEKKDESK